MHVKAESRPGVSHPEHVHGYCMTKVGIQIIKWELCICPCGSIKNEICKITIICPELLETRKLSLSLWQEHIDEMPYLIKFTEVLQMFWIHMSWLNLTCTVNSHYSYKNQILQHMKMLQKCSYSGSHICSYCYSERFSISNEKSILILTFITLRVKQEILASLKAQQSI
jgi:hypothetical protein